VRRSLALLSLLSLVVPVPCTPQAPAAQNNPEALTAAYNQAMQAKDWSGAAATAQKLVDLSGTARNLRELADALLNDGSARRDSDTITESLSSYDFALEAAEKEKPTQGQPDSDWKDNLAKVYIGKGNALLKLHRNAEAVEAYNHSAEFAANPGLAYFNICAVLYNSGNTTDSPAACRKCLQADPGRADAWFILGSVLFANSPIDPKGNMELSAETRQALSRYLELAPDGPHAADVKAMLQMAGK